MVLLVIVFYLTSHGEALQAELRVPGSKSREEVEQYYYFVQPRVNWRNISRSTTGVNWEANDLNMSSE